MATLLPVAGATAGFAVAGPIGASIGQALGGMIASFITPTQKIRLPDQEGPRLTDLRVQTSAFGNIIPEIYGSIRISGNVIWSKPLKEVKKTTTSTQTTGGKGGGGKVKQKQTTINYYYYCTLAIGICEGKIDEISRVWADGKELDKNFLDKSIAKYNVYLGSEDQTPDSIIESHLGVGKVPAHRGMAYVVMEDFPLQDYGNRIPNFSFEVQRSAKHEDTSAEYKVKELVLIPGAGEFVYGTEIYKKQYGYYSVKNGAWWSRGKKYPVNMHTYHNKADVLVALDQMQQTFPYLEYVALVVCWFATSSDAGNCELIPKIDFPEKLDGYYEDHTKLFPHAWSVAGYTRRTAQLVLKMPDGSITYGGTPSDRTVMEICKELKNRGLKVLFYPMPFVDEITPNPKPWRGRITPTSAEDVDLFFTRANGYNRFILHYTTLSVDGVYLKDKIDSFVIGTEMVGMTSYSDVEGNYPTVNHFVELASLVKANLGENVKVTYAADWSEYHHADGGWYNMDKLWASPDIDMIGIDAYFPLTDDFEQKHITEKQIKAGWENGEGWDYYYTDSHNRTGKTPFEDYKYAWKNIEWWWSNYHYNPDSNPVNIIESNIDLSDVGKWSYEGVVVTTNNNSDPEGTSNASLVLETAVDGNHAILHHFFACDDEVEYRAEIYIKPAGLTKGRIRIATNIGWLCNCVFDLSITNVSEPESYIEALDNGWFKVGTVFTTPTNASTITFQLYFYDYRGWQSHTGDPTKGFYLYKPTMMLANALPTDWIPKSKPLWFTEFGFPSVDGCSNQPNVFYDPTSSESFFPRNSKGRVDFEAQRKAINASLDFFKEVNAREGNGDFLAKTFLWTWDARPYPHWPDLRWIWADAPMWQTGHWVQGKIGTSTLGAVVAYFLERVGLSSDRFDVSELTDDVVGFLRAQIMTVRDVIEQLQTAYFFDVVESDGILKFIKRGSDSVETIERNELVPLSKDGKVRDILEITRIPDLELPREIDMTYISKTTDYDPGVAIAQRQATNAIEKMGFNIPLAISNNNAQAIAEVVLYNAWVGRTKYHFLLPSKYFWLEPTDIISLDIDGAVHDLRITSIKSERNGLLDVEGVAEDISSYDFYTPPSNDSMIEIGTLVPETRLELIDIPALPTDSGNESILKIAVCSFGENWNGCAVYRSDNGGDATVGDYNLIHSTDVASVIGNAMTTLSSGPNNRLDFGNTIDVVLLNGELTSIDDSTMMNGGNVAVIGNEIIQFANAELISENVYRLSKLLRGRLGTEHEILNHEEGERFILLDDSVKSIAVNSDIAGSDRHYKVVTVGALLEDSVEVLFAHSNNSLKPYSVCKIQGIGNANDWHITWLRRTRFDGGLKSYVDIPLNEERELYHIEFLNENDEVIRTASEVFTSEYTYTETQQIEDFGSVQDSVKIRIYQISASAGRGFFKEAFLQ